MLAEIRARLEDQCKPPFKTISPAGELARLIKAPQRHLLPQGFVIPVRHTAGPNQVATGVTQTIGERFGVLMATSSQAERYGEQASDDIETLYGTVRAALVGWQPGGAHGQILINAGQLQNIADGVLWWLDEFTVPEVIQA